MSREKRADKRLDVEPLEERIALSSVDLGSLADGLLGEANASGTASGDNIATGNDPSVSGNTINAAGGNSASTGPVNADIRP